MRKGKTEGGRRRGGNRAKPCREIDWPRAEIDGEMGRAFTATECYVLAERKTKREKKKEREEGKGTGHES